MGLNVLIQRLMRQATVCYVIVYINLVPHYIDN